VGINHVIPGGGVTAAAMRYRLLRRAGSPGAVAVTAAAIETTSATLILGIIFAAGLVLAVTGPA